MEKLYRKHKKNTLNIKKPLQFQILNWWDADIPVETDADSDANSENQSTHSQDNSTETLAYTIYCFGSTESGQSIVCSIRDFHPYYYIRLPKGTEKKSKMERILNYVETHFMLNTLQTPLVRNECGIVKKKDAFGFQNNQEYYFLKLVFSSRKAMQKSRYIFKKALTLPGIIKDYKIKLYESNFDPYIRFAHIKDLQMAGWVEINNFTKTQDSKCNHSLSISQKDIRKVERFDTANFLQASWDIEVYSYNRAFPLPLSKRKGGKDYPNEIFQIATTFQWSNEKKPIVKHLLTLKVSEPIPSPDADGVLIVVENCVNELDLINRWIKLIKNMDPDIMYTYNGDNFDCRYLVERSSLYGLTSKSQGQWVGTIFNVLSRLNNITGSLKEEKFSSSAYGDNEYFRMYIPGILNYDLLVHYKRGLKKYDSFKLDNIASNILGEKKHPVSAKDIFDKYDSGTPQDIRLIGEYCIQDTYLLQRLVDKQFIFGSILQLANVTFVPLNYLLTRGQTIKVYSQLLRKAREMKFLVPDTNFNENKYPLIIKTQEPHGFGESDCGSYATIDCGSQIVLEEEPKWKKTKMECRLVGILSPNSLAVESDLDIVEPVFNVNGKFKNKRIHISSLAPSDDIQAEESFTGATVLTPICSAFYDEIVVLDFASLYPTIIMGYNLDYSTFLDHSEYDNLPGVEYLTLEWDDTIEYKIRHTCQGVGKSGKSKGLVCGKQAFYEEKINGETMYFCRIHDPIKKTRPDSEKYATKDVHYKYRIVQVSKDPETGEERNKVFFQVCWKNYIKDVKTLKKKLKKLKLKVTLIKLIIMICFNWLSKFP